jgi:hypothetical protein
MRKAFRIVAGVFGILGVLFSVPFAVISFFDDAQEIHELHNLAFVPLYGVLLGVALLVAAWRPEENESAFLVAVASGVAGAIAGLVSGDFVSGLWFTAPISIAILWWLHPSRSRLLRPDGAHRPTAAPAVVALVPAIAFFLTQSELQRTGAAGNEHWELHHYSGMAALALALPLCAAAASLETSGRTLGAWLVGVSAALIAVASLVLSDHDGAFDPLWAWLALAWGVALLARVPTRSVEPAAR